jgi:hypothetical protein
MNDHRFVPMEQKRQFELHPNNDQDFEISKNSKLVSKRLKEVNCRAATFLIALRLRFVVDDRRIQTASHHKKYLG